MSTGRIGLGFVLLGGAIAALIPVFLVLYPAAGIGRADAANPAVVLPILARNPALFVVPGVIEMLGHAIGGAAMVGLWMRWGARSLLVSAATLAGVAWIVVDVIDSAIGVQLVPPLASAYVAGSAAAGDRFVLVSNVVDALRLGGHFFGGLWVAGIAVAALRARATHPVIAWLGVAVGAILAANPIIPALLNVSFMTLPLWVIVFGIAVARSRTAEMPSTLEAAPSMA